MVAVIRQLAGEANTAPQSGVVPGPAFWAAAL
jgi:hypothetical protein